jgi:hypothetical protein
MIYDKYSVHGYEVHLVSGYEIRCISSSGREMKSVPKDAKLHTKWAEFVQMRKEHRAWVTHAKHSVVKAMQNREYFVPTTFMAKKNSGLVAHHHVEPYDIFKAIEGMYVRAKSGSDVWDGFVDGCGEKFVKVDGKPAYCFMFLHPTEIEDLQAVQVQAIRKMYTQHIMQLFKPVYKLDLPQEEIRIERYAGVAVRKAQFHAVSSNLSWKTPRSGERKILRKDVGGYAAILEYSVDYPHDQTCYELGHVYFFIDKDAPMDVPEDGMSALASKVEAQDVPAMEVSEILWELDQLIAPCRVDDKVSEEMTAFRQQMAKVYISAMCVDRAEVIGNAVKILGHWGVYGVSLISGVSYWWKDKAYICIQPAGYATNRSKKDKGEEPAFALGEDSLDPTLALAMAKVYALANDDEPIDGVVRNQLEPNHRGVSRKGESLAEIDLEYREKKVRDARKW